MKILQHKLHFHLNTTLVYHKLQAQFINLIFKYILHLLSFICHM